MIQENSPNHKEEGIPMKQKHSWETTDDFWKMAL
jgi:hypothetical protein